MQGRSTSAIAAMPVGCSVGAPGAAGRSNSGSVLLEADIRANCSMAARLWGGQGPQLLAQLHWAFVSARLWLLCARHRSSVACLCGQQPVMGALSAVCLPRSTPRSVCLRLQAVPLGPRPMPPFALRHVHARARGMAAKCRWAPSTIVSDRSAILVLADLCFVLCSLT